MSVSVHDAKLPRVTTQSQNTQGPIIAKSPLDLLCIYFIKINLSENSKENVLVLTYAIPSFVRLS